VRIELNYEPVIDIVSTELRYLHNYFVKELENKTQAVFARNEAYDRLMIEKHIEAATVLLSWYEER
jgi:hypothetical protein